MINTEDRGKNIINIAAELEAQTRPTSKLFFYIKFLGYLIFKHTEDCILLTKKQSKELFDFLEKSNREDAKKLLEILK
jgi:hypothetical protein